MVKRSIEELLVLYFEGKMDERETLKVEKWKESSAENQLLFEEYLATWNSVGFLKTMKKYRGEEALKKVHSKIKVKEKDGFFTVLQRIAAILLLPFIISTLYFAFSGKQANSPAIWQTIKTPAGIRSEFLLPDSTKVYLNSNSSISFPMAFNGKTRDVKTNGELFFEVKKDKSKPFIVDAGEIGIEVTGTEFKVSNYASEKLTEVVLASGSVNIFQGKYNGEKHELIQLKPSERACLFKDQERLNIDKVDVDKYISWKDGILVFRDDSLKEVVRRLNRWFNADIKLADKDLEGYVYNATFENESLTQILDLLKLTAPIEYSIKQKNDKSAKGYNKMEIVIKQK